MDLISRRHRRQAKRILRKVNQILIWGVLQLEWIHWAPPPAGIEHPARESLIESIMSAISLTILQKLSGNPKESQKISKESLKINQRIQKNIQRISKNLLVNQRIKESPRIPRESPRISKDQSKRFSKNPKRISKNQSENPRESPKESQENLQES